MEETETDKSEQATPFKLKRARERGSVARSLDLGFLAALVATLGLLWVGAERLVNALALGTRSALSVAPEALRSPSALGELTARLAAPVVWPLEVFAGSLFVIALLLDFLQVGPVFSTTPLKPDFKRINPVQGFKRLFSWRMLIEAFKAVLKLAVYSVIGWLVIGDAVRGLATAIVDGARLAEAMLDVLQRLLMFSAMAALGFAILDQMFVRRDFAKKMRMSRRELKREHRDREGEPRQKQKRKQIHAEFAKAVKALRAVRGSDVVIVNPTHYAVALRYRGATMAAPQITARGAGELARRIRRVAFTYGVITVSDPPLARALYKAARVDAEIPSQCFQAVADIYLRLGLGQRQEPGQ